MSRTYVCIYKLLSPHKKMPLQHSLMYLQALRSHLVAVRIISAHNNAPPRMAGARRYMSLSFKTLHYKEELHKEEKRNSISKDRNLLCFSCKDLEYSICDKSKTYTMSDRSGDRHCNKHECYRSNL